MPSLVNPQLEDYKDEPVTPPAIPPRESVATESEPLRSSEGAGDKATILDSKGKVSSELDGFLEQAEAMEKEKNKTIQEDKEGKKDEEKETEKKSEPVKPETEKPHKEEKKEEEVPAEYMKVLPNDKPMTARRIQQFLKQIDFKDKTLAERDQIIKDLQAKTSTSGGTEELTKLNDELGKTRDELTKYRRRYQLDADPEIKAKYDEPIVEAEKSIRTVLSSDKYQLGEPTLKAIDAAGGLAEFSKSGKLFVVTEDDPNNPGQKVRVQRTAGELVRSWLNVMDIADGEYVKAQMARQFNSRDDKKRFIESEAAKANDYFKTQEAANAKYYADQNALVEKNRKDYGDWTDTQIKEKTWLQDKPVPSGATAEVKKQTEEYNQFTAQLRTMLKNPPTDSKEKIMERLLEGVEAHHLRRENGSLAAELKAAKAELGKLKGGMRTTPKGGSLLPPARKPEGSKQSSRLPANFEDAFDAAVEHKLAGGEDE
jgi:hypothetical protein